MKRPNAPGAHRKQRGTQSCRPAQQCTAGNPADHFANLAGRVVAHPVKFLVPLIFCSCLAACSILKPAPDTSRQFVLTPLPATESAGRTPGASRMVVVRAKIPAYLFNSSLAVRKGANEIVYPREILWAERLDAGIPAVLTADLSALLPKDRIGVSVGTSDELTTVVGIIIEQFDVSASGQAALVARWRILSAEGENVLRSGESHLSRNGPAPDTDPSGAVGTLSGLLADFSHQLAQALNDG